MNTKQKAPVGAAESGAESELSKIKEIAKYVQNFADFGLISNEQKEFLCQNINAAMDKLNARNAVPATEAATVSTTKATGVVPQTQNPDLIDFERLSDDENNFFETRQGLKTYLSQAGVALSREEFEKIFALVNELEKQAVARYAFSLNGQTQTPQEFEEFLKGREALRQPNQANQINQVNETAKQKLQTASAGAFGAAMELAKKFTPEQIGAMSTAQFRANEHLINEQIRRGDFKGR